MIVVNHAQLKSLFPNHSDTGWTRIPHGLPDKEDKELTLYGHIQAHYTNMLGRELLVSTFENAPWILVSLF